MPFDLACAGLALLFGILGLVRGLVRQLFGLGGFIGGMVLARLFSQPFGDAFAQDLGLPVGIAVAAMAVLIFIAVELVAKLIANAVTKSLGGVTADLNRMGGLGVGLLKGLLVAWAVASVVALLRPHLRSVEHDTPVARLDLAHSEAVAFSAQTNLITEIGAAARSDRDKLRERVSNQKR